MKVSLNIHDRLVYLGILSTFKHGNMVRWKALLAAKELLYLTEKDEEQYGVKRSEDSIIFENEKEAKKEKEYEIPDSIHFSVIEFIKMRDQQGNMTQDTFSLAQRLLPKEVEEAKDTSSTSPAKDEPH